VKWIVLLFAMGILYADTSIIKSEISKIISEIEATNTAIHIKKIQNPFLNYKKPEVFVDKTITKQIQNEPKVEAVINKKALINNKLYSVGSVIFGYVIEKITEKSVTFKKNGKTYIKSLNQSNIKIKKTVR